jgi:hypothetical protein
VYYFYFPFAAILASITLYECMNRKHPQWWAVMVFFAPITFPYFMYQSRKEIEVVHLMIFICIFSAVTGIEFFLYSRYMENNRYSHLPPVTRQMIKLSDTLRQSTIDLDHALVKLENLSKVESRMNELKETMEFIVKLRIIMNKNNQAIQALIQYTADHDDFFAKNELDWVFNLQRFYNNYNVVQHYKSLQNYLKEFEDLLRFTYSNFYKITQLKDSEILKNYDEYYIRYRRSVDSHNRFNVKRIEFQNKYLKQYPEIKAYLPGERQTETFKLWE